MTKNGFTPLSARVCPDAGGTLREFVHDKTGASVFWMDNGAENKVFSITFRTLPENSKGVFHILEHSVLNGSEKYPCKGLFSELLKGSLQTYLNAVTHPDRTTFTAASRNGRDFANLMDVYLDGVFFPLVLRDERIFRQEGWRYEIAAADCGEAGADGEEAPLSVNGVVYNEMKGDFSSPDSRLINGLAEILYPDTCYRYVSGGDPACIPTLSYDELRAVHAKYYHPSNACVFLEGDMDIEAVLGQIGGYFDRFEGRGGAIAVPVQAARSFVVREDRYPGAEEDGALMVMGQLLPGLSAADKEALTLLFGCLTGTNESPLTGAVLDSGVACDAYMYLDTNNPVPAVMMTMRQMDRARRAEAPGIVRAALAEILENGLSRESLKAEIDQLEYLVRDLDEPQGLYREDVIVRCWMYGEDPAAALDCGTMIKKLRAFLESGRYEELLRRIRFEGDGSAVFTLLPSETKGQEEEDLESARLGEIAGAMSQADFTKIEEDLCSLQAWQEQPEEEAVLALVPRLSVRDLGEQEKRFSTETKEAGSIRFLLHKADLVDIGYYALYYSLAGLTDEEIMHLSFLTNVFTGLPTEQYSITALDDWIKSLMGDLDFDIVTFADRENPAVCKPYFKVKFGALKKNESQAFALIREILTKTRFAGEDSLELLQMLLLQCRESMFTGMLEEGDRFALARAMSHLTAAGHMREIAEGVQFYEWLDRTVEACTKDASEASMAALAELADQMAGLAARVFTPGRLTASITADEPADGAAVFAGVFAEMLAEGDADMQPEQGADARQERIASEEVHAAGCAAAAAPEYIVIPGMVGYAARAGWCGSNAAAYDGSRQVLAGILDFEYLWNEVRVRGGAYGCGVFMSTDGSAGFTSFRDPDPAHSLAVFERTAAFTEAFCTDDRDIEQYIVGAVGATEPLLHARDKAAHADADWFMGITQEERFRFREQLRGADAGKLRAMTDYLTNLQTCDCIVGGQVMLGTKNAEGWKVTYLR